MSKTEKNEDLKEGKIISLRALMVIVFVAWLISALLSWYFFKDWTKSGPFGDTFGAINSIFSGLALAGIIYTIYLQKIELALQRKELEFTREELARSANAHEKSVFMMTEQLRLSNLPFLQYNSRYLKGVGCLEINNESEHPAFDVDIWLFISESEMDYPHEKFIENWVKAEHKESVKKIKLIDDEIWSISERGIYHSFPKSKKIIIPIDYKIGNSAFEIYVQYRDNLGNNYSQSIWFHNNDDDGFIPFKDSIYEPNIPTITERVDFIDKDLTKDMLPKIAKELIDLRNSSIFGSYLKDSNFKGVEYRWEMKNV